MMLITGATGQLGASVVSHLIQKVGATAFTTLARDEAKADRLREGHVNVRYGDFDKPDTLGSALAGIKKLLLISTMAHNRADQHRNVVDAAKKAGVEHIFYTSLAIRSIENSHVRGLMNSHFETEDYIKASGMKHTILRNTMYAEAIPMIVGSGLTGSSIALPGGDGRVPYVLREELAEATANAISSNGHESRTYNLVGFESYGYSDVAASLAKLQRTRLSYHQIGPDNFHKHMAANHASTFEIYLTKGTVLDIRDHQYEIESRDLQMLLGRTSKGLEAMAAEVFAHTNNRENQ